MTQDTTQSILHSAKRFFTGTILSRITGLARDVAMASAFGTHDAVSAFLVAFRFSHLLRRLLGEGALQAAFIPHFEKLRSDNPQRAHLFFYNLMTVLSTLLVIIVVITMITLGVTIFFYDLSPGNQDIAFLTLLMMPSLLFICLFGVNASLLQCEKNFFTPSAAPIIFNAIWIVGVFCLWKFPANRAMPWLAGFIVLACIGQWLITLPKVMTILKRYHLSDISSESPRSWQIDSGSQDLKNLAKPLFLGIIGVAASQINNALDSLFARYADLEGPALLWYSIRIQQLPLALFGIAISGAILPPLSRALKANDHATYCRFLELAIRRSAALMLPITAGLLVMGDRCINLIYGRGDFTDNSTLGTTQCLWAYTLGLIPMTLVVILAPAFYARDNYRTPTNAAVASMLLNVFLNTLLVMGLGYGAASVALATSISAWLNFGWLAYGLRHDLAIIGSHSLWISLVKMTLTSTLAAIIVLTFNFLYSDKNVWNILHNALPSFPPTFSTQLSYFLIESFCFGFLLIFIAWVLKTKDILILLRLKATKD